MNNHNVYQKILALFLSTILMLEFSGCYSLRGISKSESENSKRTYFIIHSSNSSILLQDVKVNGDIISGNIISAENILPKLKTVHLYVAPDSAIKVSGNSVSLDLNNIAKAEVYKISGGKSIAMGLGTIAITSLVIFLVVLIQIR